MKFLEAAKVRLLDRSRRVDYAIAFLIGVTPIMLAPVIGVESSLSYGDGIYDGYHHRTNWMSFCVILPAVLFAFRWITSRIGWRSSSSHAECPPIVRLTQGYKTSSKTTKIEELTNVFKENVFGTNSFAGATLVTILLSILDARVVGLAYRCAWMRSDWRAAEIEARCAIVEKGWSTMFLTEEVSFYPNMLFVFVAYLVQACAILMGIWLLVIMCRHNCYFMKCIYRRTEMEKPRKDRNENGRARDAAIVLAVDDPETCFGFRPAFRAFNTQVTALLAGGLVMLVSRYLNVGAAHANAIENAIETLMEAPGNLGIIATLGQTDNTNLLPNDAGQWMLIIGWLVALTVVSMPGWVKYMPLWTLLRRRKGWSITGYLEELLPDDELDWKAKRRGLPEGSLLEDPKLSEVNRTAARFSRNSFWPAGDERAKFLYFWAFFVLLVLLFPLVFDPERIPLHIAYWVFVTLLALLVAKVFFALLRRPIFYVDPRLVNSQADEEEIAKYRREEAKDQEESAEDGK